ncbi:MAG: GDPmannose 4,6-dehydratase [Parcubacteria group bacterium Gr01-1014_38]|nr:MAG: GDPmannose 4,6-dehydratase [Parcubacteria group bacterium Gr01-1014_38]
MSNAEVRAPLSRCWCLRGTLLEAAADAIHDVMGRHPCRLIDEEETVHVPTVHQAQRQPCTRWLRDCAVPATLYALLMAARANRALITGITGQDGSYLAEFLLEKGYEVYGLIRRSSTEPFERIQHIQHQLRLISGDLLDERSLIQALAEAQPSEVYNLAAQSFVQTSWDQSVFTGEVTALGVTRLLNAIRTVDPTVRFYQASSSEMFGNIPVSPQNEETPFYPRSPYGVAKVYGHWITVNYRESYGLYTVSGILFNHESPRRGFEFVTRKIANGVAQIKYGVANELCLGTLDAKRDWGFAGDYVRAMWLMLQQPQPRHYVIGTGEIHSVREFAERAFREAGLDWKDHVKVDPRLFRPAEIHQLVADPRRARTELGWQPTMSFPDLVSLMVRAELERLEDQLAVRDARNARHAQPVTVPQKRAVSR